jgi:hypothetical protein
VQTGWRLFAGRGVHVARMLSLFCVELLAAAAALGSVSSSPIVFTRTTDTLKIDGWLDEEAWNTTPRFSAFYEVYPRKLSAPQTNTEVRALYNDDSLFIGVRADDPSPEEIRSDFTKRDQVDSAQDYIELLIVPQQALRTAFMFRVNAVGSQADGLFREDTGIRDFAFDTDFEVRSQRTSDGWIAEIKIPVSSLRFSVRGMQSWKIVVYRNLPRTVSTTLSSAPIERGSNCVLCVANSAQGITLARNSHNLTITPYATYTRSASEDRAKTPL